MTGTCVGHSDCLLRLGGGPAGVNRTGRLAGHRVQGDGSSITSSAGIASVTSCSECSAVSTAMRVIIRPVRCAGHACGPALHARCERLPTSQPRVVGVHARVGVRRGHAEDQRVAALDGLARRARSRPARSAPACSTSAGRATAPRPARRRGRAGRRAAGPRSVGRRASAAASARSRSSSSRTPRRSSGPSTAGSRSRRAGWGAAGTRWSGRRPGVRRRAVMVRGQDPLHVPRGLAASPPPS